MNGSALNITMGVRYFEPRGGAEKFSLRLARHLADRGHSVRVVCFSGQPMAGVRLDLLPWPRACGRARRDWATGEAIAAALVADHAADVRWGEQKTWHADVIRPGGGSEAEFWRLRAAERPWGPLAALCSRKRRYDLDAERRGYTDAALRAVVVNSAMVRGHLLRDHPGLAGRIHVVHNGNDLRPPDPGARAQWRREVRAEHGIPEQATLALLLGNGFPRKGLGEAIAAVARARGRTAPTDLWLLAVGRGRAPAFAAQARRAGVGDRVVIRDATRDVARLYAAADVFILPSHFDPFANVTIEALGMGLPVITTRTNGGSEVVTPDGDGWVVDTPADIAGLADALRAACDPETLRRMSAAALAAAARHRLDGKLEAVEAVLAGVARRRG